MTNAQCNNDNAGFGEWVVNDGSGDMTIDDLMFSYTPILTTIIMLLVLLPIIIPFLKSYQEMLMMLAQFVGISDDKPLFNFPNPAVQNEWLNFNLSEDTKIEFYTLSGKLLIVFISSGKQVTNIDFLSSGTYIIKANGIAYSLSVL